MSACTPARLRAGFGHARATTYPLQRLHEQLLGFGVLALEHVADGLPVEELDGDGVLLCELLVDEIGLVVLFAALSRCVTRAPVAPVSPP